MSAPPASPLPPRLATAILVVAPALLLLSTVVQVAGDGLGGDRVGGAVQVWCGAAFALAVLVLAGLLAPHRPGWAAVLSVTGILGATGAIGFGYDGMVYAADPTVALSEQDSPEVALALMTLGILFPLTLAALGAALGRVGGLPRSVAAAVVVGALLFPVSRIGVIEPLAIAVDVILLGALVATAVVVGRPADATASPVEAELGVVGA